LIRALATKSADPSFKNLHRLGFRSYVATVRDAMVNAKEKVVVVTPFMDQSGIELLEESWRTRANDASWEVYVRSANASLRKTAEKLGWKLFEYPEAADSGMHAKFVSIDKDRVIIGSMNLLRRSMYSNLEIGVDITEDPLVAKMIRLEGWLQEVSVRVRPQE